MTHKYKHINLIKDFKSFIAQHQLITPKDQIVLAVSGGLDSVIMADLFHTSRLPFAIAHCNFGLRGADSEADATWVATLAHQYGAPFHVSRLDVAGYIQQKGGSVQMAARDLRYHWFKALCLEKGYNKLATAHHANDVLETVLFNLTKGTGMAGFHGILPQRASIIRPLLFASKSDLLAYAKTKGLAWREDGSNDKDDYARNLIRHHVVPALQKINPDVVSTLSHTIERLRQVETFFKQGLDQWYHQIVSQRPAGSYFHLAPIRHQPWVAVACWEWLKPFGFNFAQVNSLLQGHHIAGKMLYTSTHQLVTDTNGWLVTKKVGPRDPKQHSVVIPQHATTVMTDLYALALRKFKAASYQISYDPAIAALDEAKLCFPLTIRPWQQGDIFYPLGMQQRKKVSDFLIDRKVPLWEKEKIAVVCSNGTIAWIIGYQIDERFKLTPATEYVYELTLVKRQLDNI